MLDEDRPASGGGLQRQQGVARALGGVDAARQRQREGAEAGEQVGDRRRARSRLAHGGDQRRLPVRGRLQEGGGRQRHGHRSEGDGGRLRFPAGLGAEPLVDHNAGKAVRLGKGRERLGRRQAGRKFGLDEQVDALIGERQVQVGATSQLEALRQRPQRRDEREQRRVQDVTLAHVDDGVAARRGEADQPALGVQRRTAAGARGREIGRPDGGGQPLRVERGGDTVGDEARVAGVVEVLELAAAADREMAAGRRLVMWARDHRAGIGQRVTGRRKRGVSPVRRDALAPRRDAQDRAHSDARAGVSARARSSAMKLAPHRRAASA